MELGHENDDEYPGRLLQQAAIYNNVDLMDSLLQGAVRRHINAQDNYGRTALYTSITNNSYECSERLLVAGADANIACGLQCGGMSPLHAAALDNKDRFVRLLLAYRADVNKMDASGERPLALAIKNRSHECLVVIKEQIETNEKMKDSVGKDFVKACCMGNADMAKNLLHDTVLSEDDVLHLADSHNLLHVACENGHLEVCEFLLEIGAAIKSQPTTGHSPLHIACIRGHSNCIRAILRFWPDQVEVLSPDGCHPIHLACIHGQLEVVKQLLAFLSEKNTNMENSVSKIAVLDLRDGRLRTPLHVAVENNRLEIVEYFLSLQTSGVLSGFDGVGCEKNPPHQSGEQKTSGEHLSGSKRRLVDITSCCSRQHSRELRGGVDIDVEDDEGKTPLHYAVLGNEVMAFFDVAAILLQHKADPNKHLLLADGTNSSPLTEAFRRSDRALMSLLLRHGAKDDDLKLMSAAVDQGDDEMIGVMIQYQSYLDLEYKPNHLAIAQAQHELEKSSALGLDCSRSFSAGYNGIAINWHAMGLKKVCDLWVLKACLNQLKKSHLSVEWVMRNQAVGMLFVTRIDISENGLELLPDFLFRLPSLRSLNASSNKVIEVVKHGISEDVLNASSCNGSSEDVRESEYFARNEERLGLNCPSLEEINLCRNQLSTVPNVFFRMPALKKLNVSHNGISSMPFEMWTSTSLLELNLSHNKLEILPYQSDSRLVLEGRSTLGSSTPEVKAIYARHSGMSLPESQGNSSISNFDTFPVDHQQFLETSPDMQQNYVNMYMPKYINRWHDKVLVQSSDFDGETDLTLESRSQLLELNLSYNLFEVVPTALSCLAPQLEKLVLSHNSLTQIGLPTAYPASLKSLDLSNNHIADEANFENGIDIRKSTTQFNTRSCYSPFQTKSFTSQVSLLHSVSTPSVTSTWNFATCKHRLHHRLERLRVLKLDNNKIQKFVVCFENTDDNNLTSSDESTKSHSPLSRQLRISRDYGEKKKAEVLYPNLTSLDLSHNKLVNLTSDVCELANLAELKISYNRIKELPPEMGIMRKLWNVDFSSCPVADSLRSLLGDKARKTSAVLGYLKSIRDEAVPFNRMKLMLVGIQGIGKTSLLNQLRDKKTRNTHWVERMGHKTQGKDQKGDNISTVGVDIGDLEIQGPTGKVIFSTWDFGGQKEYYATHQYFLSKRSLYLVVWRVTDGEKGVNEILRWLINIQARVPGSPVIIVGTHRDQIPKKNRQTFLFEMGRLIEKKFIQVNEPDKLGLPRVLGHIEVTCKNSLISKTYIQELRSLVWKVVSEEQLSGGRGTRLLEQKVPAKYLHLQVIVETLARERKAQHKDPVLHADQYKHMVIAKMEEMYRTSFQDMSELSQATQFLHENGVLLHYDEVNLQDIYFLDPQWLCDMLASIITIREINSLAKSGVMKTEDLKVLFKGVAFKGSDIKMYMINLLHKFEVALLWDQDHLLIPSLLPTENDVLRGLPDSHVLIPLSHSPVVIYEWNLEQNKEKEIAQNSDSLQTLRQMPLSKTSSDCLDERIPATFHGSPVSSSNLRQSKALSSSEDVSTVTNIHNPAVSLVRIYLMSYFPCGFWPRLITRLLGDKTFLELALLLYDSDYSLPPVAEALRRLKRSPQWQCWQTGLELKLSEITILRLKEVLCESPLDKCDYANRCLLIKHEQDFVWSPVDARAFSVLEIFIPNETLQIGISGVKDEGQSPLNSVTVNPNAQTVASLLATTVDRIDTLLEDWYPDIGTRFAQNTTGTYLITRLVPCIHCLFSRSELLDCNSDWAVVSPSPCFAAALEGGSMSSYSLPASPGILVNGLTSGSLSRLQSSNSPVPGRSALETHFYGSWPTVENPGPIKHADGIYSCIESDADGESEVAVLDGIYCFLFEACLQAAHCNKVISCPSHGNLGPIFAANESGVIYSMHIAPDTIFQDIGDDRLIHSDTISWGKFLGRGGFGAVFAGTIINKMTGDTVPVAMKVLQPVKPNSDASESQLQQYDIEKAKWNRDPIKNGCEAYLNARKELGIMLTLKHPSIVPLLGISIMPLTLILSLAPLGTLSNHLKDYERAGSRLPIYVIRDVIIQVASALQYLHSLQIIYRDLKSENVLVWSLPPPRTEDDDRELLVDVKLADYGISRVVLPIGTKGFAGTLPFMAPEIIQHNGEEMYTEKVDCFSFGMFIYELLLLKPPYEDMGTINGSNINLKGHVMSGGRPKITAKEVFRQVNVLDLMTLCWSCDPGDRPSAEEIVHFAQSPDFCSLFNAVLLENAEDIVCACSVKRPSDLSTDGQFGIDDVMSRLSQSDVWVSLRTKEDPSGSLVVCTFQEQECLQIKKLDVSFPVVSVMCVTSTDIWCASSSAVIHIFRQSDYKEILKFAASSRLGTSVRCMAFSTVEDVVYSFLDDGHFVVCGATIPVNFEPSYTPVRKEYPGNGRPVHCAVSVSASQSAVELWCGQGGGKITVWNFESFDKGVRTLNHFSTEGNNVDTVHLVMCPSDPFTLYSYVYPGTMVYCWDTSTKSLLLMVDLIHQISPEYLGQKTPQNSSKFKANKWQVTCMNVIDQYLYVGTTGGCLLVINKHSMMPLTLCQPHRDGFPNISVILPLSFPKSLETNFPLPSGAQEPSQSSVLCSGSMFVTIGKGYRDLASRLMRKYAGDKAKDGIFVIVWSGEEWPTSPG